MGKWRDGFHAVRVANMKTLEQFAKQTLAIPMATVWLLNDLAEYRGKQELFTKQSPQKLKVLREHAIIEQSKERYYETLQQCSQNWHEGRHDPWPYVNYLLYTLKELYQEFERRVGEVRASRGEKTELVQQAVAGFRAPFHITELQQKCHGVSLDMIRKVLKDMSEVGEVKCTGRGKKALWRVLGNR